MLRKTYLYLAIVTLLLVSPASIPRAWKLTPAGLESESLPTSLVTITPPVQADLDGDGLPERVNISKDGQATLLRGEKLVWQSPQTWQVRQALIADLNQDGRWEAVLLVWRPFKPWPVDNWLPSGGRINNFHNQAGLSCHLILIGWYQNAYRELWAGSALAEPIRAFAAADLSGTGKQVLVTLDDSYDAPPAAPASQLKVWEWNGFGFRVVSKIEGRFDRLMIARAADGQALILVH